MSRFERFLQRLGVIPEFDEHDIFNAETEDLARQNEKVVGRLQQSLSRRFEVNERLRHSITIAKRRTSSFEEFEQLISSRRSNVPDH